MILKQYKNDYKSQIKMKNKNEKQKWKINAET